MLAFDALEEVERIDGLLEEYRAVLAGVRPRMEAEDLNRDYSRTIERLRFDPDAIPLQQQWNNEDVMAAAERIMKGIQWRKAEPPVS